MESKQKVDVLLVNPGSPSAVYQALSNEFSAFEPPSLAALFATYIRVKGGSVDIIDAPVNHWSPEQLATQINDRYSPLTIHHSRLTLHDSRLKKPEVYPGFYFTYVLLYFLFTSLSSPAFPLFDSSSLSFPHCFHQGK